MEHLTIDVEGFRVADATATGNRAHDDLVWVGYGGMEGQWLATEKVLALVLLTPNDD